MDVELDRYHTFLDEDEAAETLVADLIGYRTHPHKGQFFAVSVVRSHYREDALVHANLSNGDLTRDRLQALSIMDVMPAIEFLSFSTGYLAARMFMPSIGEGPALSRMVLPDSEALPEEMRKASLDRAKEYIPALSDIHDNRAAPRDSRLAQRLLAGYVALLIEDPRQSTLDSLLSGYEEADIQRGNSGLTARQIAQAVDTSRLWGTLGWRRGQAERRFRLDQRGTYLENISGDVRVMFEPESAYAGFSDIRRLRRVDLESIRGKPHPCDDKFIAAGLPIIAPPRVRLWARLADASDDARDHSDLAADGRKYRCRRARHGQLRPDGIASGQPARWLAE